MNDSSQGVCERFDKKDVERPEQYKCRGKVRVGAEASLSNWYVTAFPFCCFWFRHAEILILIYFCWILAIGFLLLGSLCLGTSYFPTNWLLFMFHWSQRYLVCFFFNDRGHYYVWWAWDVEEVGCLNSSMIFLKFFFFVSVCIAYLL